MLFAALALAAATSCTNDDAQGTDTAPDGAARTVTLTASTPEPDGEKPAAGKMRVGLTRKDNTAATFYWQDNDEILVQTNNGGTYGQAEFKVKSNDRTSATFEGELTGSVGTYAVYPYNAAHKFDTSTGTKLTYNLPAAYTYMTVESGIFSKTENGSTTYRTTQTNIPMLGTITDSKVAFKILGGVAVIRIDQMPVAEGTLTVTADQKLSGDFTVEDMSATEPAITTATATAAADKTVTFGFSGVTTGSVGVFFLPLATGTYTNLTITVADASGTVEQTVNYGSLTIARRDVTAISLTTDSEGNLRYIEKTGDYTYIINGHEFVDLGLDVLWATMNVGATDNTEVGYHFAWGETTTKTNYSANSYNSTIYGKYFNSSSLTQLDAENDPATVHWGSGCRLATTTEFNALNSNCTWTYSGSGYAVANTTTGASIFLPSTGYYNGTSLMNSSDQGYYLLKSRGTASERGGRFYFKPSEHKYWDIEYYLGCAARPVVVKPSTSE